MRGTRAAAVAAVLLAVALCAACGSSSKPLTKADFVAKADAVCQKTTDRFVAATKDLQHPSPAQVTDSIKTQLVPLLKRQDKDLAKLVPPAADRTTVAKFLADMRAVTADVDKNTQAFVAAHGVTAPVAQASKEARAYGFKVCAKTGSG